MTFIVHSGFQAEREQVPLRHKIGHRRALANQTGGGIGIVGCSNHHRAMGAGHALNMLGHRVASGDDHTACTQFDGQDLRLGTVTDNYGISLFDHTGHGGGIARGHADLAVTHTLMDIADHHGAVQRLHHIFIGRLGVGHGVRVKGVHISCGHIGHSDQALQTVLLVHNGQRVSVAVAHQVPCIFHGHAAAHSVHPADAQILHLGADVAAQIWRGKAEIVQHKFRFTAENAGAARLVMQRWIDFIF